MSTHPLAGTSSNITTPPSTIEVTRTLDMKTDGASALAQAIVRALNAKVGNVLRPNELIVTLKSDGMLGFDRKDFGTALLEVLNLERTQRNGAGPSLKYVEL